VRQEYVPTTEVIAELDIFFAARPPLDYVTFSGGGEPTLHVGLEQIINHLKRNCPEYRIALLTNGTLFARPEVRRAVLAVDLLVPSLDAVTESVMTRINRPVDGVSARELLAGLVALRKEFKGEIWLEIFLVAGCNDTPAELLALRTAVESIKPDRIQINTLDRPGTESNVSAVAAVTLRDWQQAFGDRAEIIARVNSASGTQIEPSEKLATIYNTIKRRPCTVKDLEQITGLPADEVEKIIKKMLQERQIMVETGDRGDFFRAL